MENHGLTDVTFEVRHSLVQLSLGHGVPLRLGQYSEWKHLQMLRVSKYLSSLVHGNLLEVEQERPGVRSSSPLAVLRQGVTGGAPAGSPRPEHLSPAVLVESHREPGQVPHPPSVPVPG